jgi:hypothetical protein
MVLQPAMTAIASMAAMIFKYMTASLKETRFHLAGKRGEPQGAATHLRSKGEEGSSARRCCTGRSTGDGCVIGRRELRSIPNLAAELR